MSAQCFLVHFISFCAILLNIQPRVADSNNVIRCMEEEREALLEFKQSLVDEYGILSSWGREDDKRDCCYWRGVRCSNTTGHVIVLDLQVLVHSEPLKGTISPSLLKLYHLRHLDLSENDFSGSRIPEFIGSLNKLRYLSLSSAEFEGPIPSQLGNLSRLKYLDLSYINLNKSRDWLRIIDKLPSLRTLNLEHCHLPPIIPSDLLHLNFSTSSLGALYLFENSLSSSIYPWLFNISSKLVVLDLDSNLLQGSLLEPFDRMVSLRTLYLGFNELEGGIPQFFGNMCSLNTLDLSSNKLSGQLWDFIQNLSGGCMNNSLDRMYKLDALSLSGNSLTGVVTESVFSELSNLKALHLDDNSFTLKFSHDWIPPFQLIIILLGSCQMGPHFPKWLQTQNQIEVLDISDAGISDTVPDWFWDLSHTIADFNLSNNHIKGKLPNLSLRFDPFSSSIDISSNYFEGLIPPLPSNASVLNLSRNKFSESISFLCSINGHKLEFLDLSNNILSGRLPDCWMQFDRLAVLSLANNFFSGKIPKSMGFLHSIQTLSLYNNSLIGELPSFFKSCSQLILMDLGKNGLSGEIPTWIGEGLPKLVVLSLKSNKFHGNIPFQVCQLSYIQILDLSLNNISGIIPKCLNNFTGMAQKSSSNLAITSNYTFERQGIEFLESYVDNVVLTWKGSQHEYRSTLGLVKILDFSMNKLSGTIPEEIMDLVGLVALNLSRNNLTGQITPKIDQLKSLDFLDLSQNQFVGGIPSSLCQLSRLSVMNLSYNNLSGKIPLGTQLQSFNASVYAGNPELCGLPLRNKCPDEDSAASPERDDANTPEGEDQLITFGFYVSVILGFFIGFWGVCGTLLVNTSWRHGYFKFLTSVKDWVYLITAVNIAKLQRTFRD
ncbi:hypothetical protein KPL70_024951 [Citrus sinensis]|nr:hypothetical protein KPL70_024951 [Citrus sinensis]